MKSVTLVVFFLLCRIWSLAQGTVEDYRRSKEIKNAFEKVYRIPTQIIWSEDGNSFSYKVKLKDGGYTYYLVDVLGKQKKAIKLSAIVEQMSRILADKIELNAISEEGFKILNLNEIEFIDHNLVWNWNINDNKLQKMGKTVLKKSTADQEYWGDLPDENKENNLSSPDKHYTAYIKNNNVFFCKKGDPKSERQLTFDGTPKETYAVSIQWSSDSKKIAVNKLHKVKIRQLTLLESSPSDQLQPRLLTRNYSKPGDELQQSYPAIIDVQSGQIMGVDSTQVSNQYGLSNISWRKDNSGITFEYNQRGHQRYDVLELSAINGQTKPIISEVSATFIQYSGKKYRKDLEGTQEIIWASERDGWNHLYLFDGKTGILKKQITKGNWVMRKVIHVDEKRRKIIFEASGMKKDEDPYLIRYYTIGMDGKGLKELTPEHANHEGNFNKQHSYFMDVFSLVDQAPKAVLRSVDGTLLMELEQADISDLLATGWRAPEAFLAKGRDGKTDIWGFIVRPRNFDPNKKYPIIECIYAGPQNSFVPKSFVVNPFKMHEVAELGFIMVRIDGMGTSNRSKAFQDVAWKNLKDAGFPDRIAWMKAAAKKYPYMDIERVGIHGASAGGQSSTGALLFHPEFYKVAVSSCGCHDNRMDKIWWNEQWMGWPIGPHYAECSNVENAYRLQGKLMLIVGELDDNVDPSSTYQVVNQLIKHNKDHEFIMFPGLGHSAGADFGEKKRRDFFVKHLLGVNPPSWDQY